MRSVRRTPAECPLFRRGLSTLAVMMCALALAPSAKAAFTTVSAGTEHSCAVTEAGAVGCWGENEAGQLGTGTATATAISKPAAVSGLSSDVAEVSAGGYHTCALTEAGAVDCWGAGGGGQLGDGSTTDRSTPAAVTGLSSGVRQIAAGFRYTCALTEAGAVECWGDGGSGQLGDGTTTESSVPVEVSGLSSGVKEISAGYEHACAVTETGAVDCWGRNNEGQLGDGTATSSSTPVAVMGLPRGVEAVSAGDYHTCALTDAGGIECWGDGGSGQLGDGSTTGSSTPVAVSGLSSGVAEVSAGAEQTCAVTEAGAVECWGANDKGQLGDATTTDSSTPVAVSGLSSGVAAVSAGWHDACALTEAGAVDCWGENDKGQLGDGTTTDSSVPVLVSQTPQTITFPTLAPRVTGEADVEPGATASSGLPVTYTSGTASVCTIVSGKIHLVSAGECIVTAEQPGGVEYAAAASVSRSFAVTSVSAAVVTPTQTAAQTPAATPVPVPRIVLLHTPNTPHRHDRAGGPRWTFTFTDSVPGVTYRCRLGGHPWHRCVSPTVYRHLARGPHVFRLRSVDAAGHVSPVETVRFWVGRRRS